MLTLKPFVSPTALLTKTLKLTGMKRVLRAILELPKAAKSGNESLKITDDQQDPTLNKLLSELIARSSIDVIIKINQHINMTKTNIKNYFLLAVPIHCQEDK